MRAVHASNYLTHKARRTWEGIRLLQWLHIA
jgi:hypothetical protein